MSWPWWGGGNKDKDKDKDTKKVKLPVPVAKEEVDCVVCLGFSVSRFCVVPVVLMTRQNCFNLEYGEWEEYFRTHM